MADESYTVEIPRASNGVIGISKDNEGPCIIIISVARHIEMNTRTGTDESEPTNETVMAFENTFKFG